MGTAAPPANTVHHPSPVSGFRLTLLLVPSVAELVSASVLQSRRPEVTLPAATPVIDVAPTEVVTVAVAPESSPLLSWTLVSDTPTSVVQPLPISLDI